MRCDRDYGDRSPVDRYAGITPSPAYYIPPIAMTFSGPLAAGKTLDIDKRDFSVLNDGVNAIGDFDGEFPDVAALACLTYEDDESSRTIAVTVTDHGPIDTIPAAPTLIFTYAGPLAVGETLEIDANNLTVENDGISELANFSGDFPMIGPGTNTITYTDSGGSRTVLITVTRKERSV